MILSKQRKNQTNTYRKAILAILFGGIFLMPLMAGIRIVQSMEEYTPMVEQTVENRKTPEESTGKASQDASAELNESIGKSMLLQPPEFKIGEMKPDKIMRRLLSHLQGGAFRSSVITFRSVFTDSEGKNEDALQAYVGTLEDIQKMGNIAEGIFRLRKSADSLKSLRYATIGRAEATQPQKMYLALNYVEQPSLILKLPPKVGGEWTGRAYKHGIEGRTVVESTAEKVEVPAGIFENCLKVQTMITDGAAKGALFPKDAFIQSMPFPKDAFIRGTRTMYFAPGVGLVKLEYQHGTGHRTKIVLVDYAVQRDTGYFPLDVDNTWTYRWEDGYLGKRESFTEVWTVKAQEGDVYTIHCAMRRPPEVDASR